MSGISLATLGVQCEDRALSMATLGVFCGEVVVVQPDPRINTDTGQGRVTWPTVVNVIARPVDIEPGRHAGTFLFEPTADAINQIFIGSGYAIGASPDWFVTDKLVADAIANFDPADGLKLNHGYFAARGHAVTPEFEGSAVPVNKPVDFRATGAAIVTMTYEEVTLVSEYGEFDAKGVQNLSDEELIAVLHHLRRRKH